MSAAHDKEIADLKTKLVAAEKRIAALEEVARAARVVTADGGSATDGCGCEWCTLLDALRRLNEPVRPGEEKIGPSPLDLD